MSPARWEVLVVTLFCRVIAVPGGFLYFIPSAAWIPRDRRFSRLISAISQHAGQLRAYVSGTSKRSRLSPLSSKD